MIYTISMGRPQDFSVQTVLATQGIAGGGVSPDTGRVFTIGNIGFLFIEPNGLDIGSDSVPSLTTAIASAVSRLNTLEPAGQPHLTRL